MWSVIRCSYLCVHICKDSESCVVSPAWLTSTLSGAVNHQGACGLFFAQVHTNSRQRRHVRKQQDKIKKVVVHRLEKRFSVLRLKWESGLQIFAHKELLPQQLLPCHCEKYCSSFHIIHTVELNNFICYEINNVQYYSSHTILYLLLM